MRKLVATLLVAVFMLGGCGKPQITSGDSSQLQGTVGGSTRRNLIQSSELQFQAPGPGDVKVTMQTSKGEIQMVLYPQYAPLAVENFCTLASQGYYDQTEFHRIVKDFIIQGGDKDKTGLSGTSAWGTPFQTERSEFLRHYSGALCMAGADGQPDTHLSQFYIMATPQNALDEAALQQLQNAGLRQEVIETYRQAGGAPYLDFTDTVFGQVVEGMDIVDMIANGAVAEESQRPKSPVVIQSIQIENYQPLYIKGRPVYTAPSDLTQSLPDNLDAVPENVMEEEEPVSSVAQSASEVGSP